jgi:hypothetical protein
MQQFNFRRVLGKCARLALAEFFAHHGTFDNGIERAWLEDPATKPEDILTAYHRLPQSLTKIMGYEFRNAFELGTAEGMQIILGECTARGIDLADSENIEGLLERALWFSMRYPDVWEAAIRFAQADAVKGGRSWVKRSGIAQRVPDVSEEAKSLLCGALSEFFLNKEGRGHRAEVDHLSRADGGEYFFVYLSDFPDAKHCYDEDGRLKRVVQRPSFEVIFAFHPNDGVLELFSKGGKKTVPSLQNIFARTILHTELPPESGRQEYALNMLLDPDMSFPTDPEDGIERVAVHALECHVLGRPDNFRMSFRTPVDEGRSSIHDVLDNDLAQNRVSRATLDVRKARLCFYFANTTGRSKTMKVNINLPNTSDLKSKREDMARIGRKYLQRWGIDSDVA